MVVSTNVPLRKLGQSALEISALGLGCWQFSKGRGMVGRFWAEMDQHDINEIVKMSLEGGINWFDTAEVYGKGESEKALAEALESIGLPANDALIATKWWPMFRTASSITKTIDHRIEALDGRTIDLHQIHQPFSFSSVEKEMEAMVELLKANKIKHVGVSNFNEDKMKKAHQVLSKHGYFLASNQVKYSLLDRSMEKNGVLEAAKQLGITIIAYSPLEQGILSGKFHKHPELVKKIQGPRKYMSFFKPAGLAKTKPLIDLLEEKAKKYGVSQTQIALNWLIHFHGETVVAIPGASKPHHVQENIGALQFTLSKEDLDEIDQVSRQVALFD
ncbi:aldo/keto reductase [Aquibacillus koreensis]|uniref:Aldo/keto reductase n=1 Tax=Aquibacillus koreensis TaxID=279446 RepID=A0A9X4ALK7_9BACI|nr:aldo/keto reductase [Aquibacillus koreensis]MCT2534181.1 aldo/keto reductase [Aquibacillus koreensis]MDC3422573.1 aldo/keto reductase [Aquibacillus koreensis]